MPRPPALKVLINTPTSPCEAGSENRLCQKCGRWNGDLSLDSLECAPEYDSVRKIKQAPDIIFVGDLDENDKTFVGQVAQHYGIDGQTRHSLFLPSVLCQGDEPTPNQLRYCRAFILGAIRDSGGTLVLALGSDALASLLGKYTYKNVDPVLGRELEVEGMEDEDVTFYATYHPKEQTARKKDLQKGMRLVADIKKYLTATPLEKPTNNWTHSTEWLGFDTEFDDEHVWTLGFGNDSEYSVLDKGNPNHDLPTTDLRFVNKIIGHYAQCEIDSLVRLGLCKETWLKGKDLLDTLILANLHNENLPRLYHSKLESVLCRLYLAPNWKAETEVLDEAKPGDWGLEKRTKRCGYDAWATYKIYEHPQIQQIINRSPGVVKWVHRMLPTYHRMKYVGVAIDKKEFDRHYNETLPKEQMYYQRVTGHVRSTYNWPEFEPTKSADLVELLYNKMKLPKLKFTKSGAPSTDADALQNFKAHPGIEDLLEWRTHNKLMTTWYGKESRAHSVPLYERIHWYGNTGYLPVNLGVGQTSTLRRQSNAPNMQNWNKSTRSIVTSRFGEKGTLIWADYAKLEVFVLADEIKCDKLTDYFLHRGGYLGIAKDLMGQVVTKDHENYRATKAVVLAANYNASPFTVANQLYYKAGVRYSEDFGEVPFKEKFKTKHYTRTKEIVELYFQMFPKIKLFHENVKRELLATQQVVSRLGQVRHLPCPKGEATPMYKHLYNQAINFKIQSVAGFVTGIAAVLLEERFVQEFHIGWQEYHEYLMWMHKKLTEETLVHTDVTWKHGAYICNETHDELLTDTENTHKEWVKDAMQEVMTEAVKEPLLDMDPTFNVHLDIELEEGTHWHRTSS